jgi:hypothetical protein
MDNYSTPKKMKTVGDLFEKYRKLLKPPQASVEKECLEVIGEVTGFDLSDYKITYTVSTRTISLGVPSILKTEIKFNQEKILNQLKVNLGEANCPKVII